MQSLIQHCYFCFLASSLSHNFHLGPIQKTLTKPYRNIIMKLSFTIFAFAFVAASNAVSAEKTDLRELRGRGGRRIARQCCQNVEQASCGVFEAGSECQGYVDDAGNKFTGCEWDAEDARCEGIKPPKCCKGETVDTCGITYSAECQARIDDTTNNFQGCMWDADVELCKCLKTEIP